jgi:hypothetical protein
MKKKDLEHLSNPERQAVLSLCDFISAQVKVDEGVPQPEVSVYTFKQRGFRVAEISLTWNSMGGMSGHSYMRGDAGEGLEVILAAEDFVLNFYEKPFRPRGWQTNIDNKAEAEDRLLYALNRSMDRRVVA